jgi:hypothetical protein
VGDGGGSGVCAAEGQVLRELGQGENVPVWVMEPRDEVTVRRCPNIVVVLPHPFVAKHSRPVFAKGDDDVANVRDEPSEHGEGLRPQSIHVDHAQCGRSGVENERVGRSTHQREAQHRSKEWLRSLKVNRRQEGDGFRCL